MIDIYFVSLGCDKNLVDSEKMLAILDHAGYRLAQEPEQADVIVVNTCAFIHDAKQESIETLLEREPAGYLSRQGVWRNATKKRSRRKCRRLTASLEPQPMIRWRRW